MKNSVSDDPNDGQASSFCPKISPAPIKVFGCKYCARKFINSRALGGHQNAHKKEKTLRMMGLHDHSKQLRIEPYYHEPIPEEALLGKAKESVNRFHEADHDQDLMSWPGSFYIHSIGSNEGSSSNGEALNLELVLDSQNPDQSKKDICELDLDLRL